MSLGSQAFADEAEQVRSCRYCKHFFVGKFRIGVVALTLSGGVEPSSLASADEQINANERILPVGVFCFGGRNVRVIHVAKGGLRERTWLVLFKSPAAAWFSTLNRHYLWFIWGRVPCIP